MASQLTLATLPDEILQTILQHLSPQDTLALEATSRRFSGVTNEPQLWKAYCRRDWAKWDTRHNIQEKFRGTEFLGWRGMYQERLGSRDLVRSCVRAAVEKEIDRFPRIDEVVALGGDSRDELARIFEKVRWNDGSPDGLAVRYWAYVISGCVHRSMAVNMWVNLREREERHEAVSFEEMLAPFDLFLLGPGRSGDPDEIFAKLDGYTEDIRSANTDIDALSPRDKATSVARYLLDNGLIGIRPGRDYHNVEHNFLGVALHSAQHNSLPIISVVIYCYILRKLGLRAAPCSFPFHVHAVVRPPLGFDLDGNALTDDSEELPREGVMMYMDPFRSSAEVPVSSLEQQLGLLSHQFSAADRIAYLVEASPREIATRCAHNILNSRYQTNQAPLEPVSRDAASYAAHWALILFPTDAAHQRQSLATLMQEFVERFIHDVGLIEAHVLPVSTTLLDYTQWQRGCRQLRQTDEVPHVPHRRVGPSAVVKHRIGQVFKHRRYHYIGVITGWDYKCLTGEAWIRRMGVDSLPDGRYQPFYHVLALDETTRYVAEESVEVFTVEEEDARRFPIEVGRYFKRWDPISKLFVSNAEEEYPED